MSNRKKHKFSLKQKRRLKKLDNKKYKKYKKMPEENFTDEEKRIVAEQTKKDMKRFEGEGGFTPEQEKEIQRLLDYN